MPRESSHFQQVRQPSAWCPRHSTICVRRVIRTAPCVIRRSTEVTWIGICCDEIPAHHRDRRTNARAAIATTCSGRETACGSGRETARGSADAKPPAAQDSKPVLKMPNRPTRNQPSLPSLPPSPGSPDRSTSVIAGSAPGEALPPIARLSIWDQDRSCWASTSPSSIPSIARSTRSWFAPIAGAATPIRPSTSTPEN